MNLKVRVSINLVGCSDYSIIEICEEDIAGMSEQEIEEYFSSIAVDEIMSNGLIDWGWSVVD